MRRDEWVMNEQNEKRKIRRRTICARESERCPSSTVPEDEGSVLRWVCEEWEGKGKKGPAHCERISPLHGSKEREAPTHVFIKRNTSVGQRNVAGFGFRSDAVTGVRIRRGWDQHVSMPNPRRILPLCPEGSMAKRYRSPYAVQAKDADGTGPRTGCRTVLP